MISSNLPQKTKHIDTHIKYEMKQKPSYKSNSKQSKLITYLKPPYTHDVTTEYLELTE